jgi:hypothetical protein
MAAGVGGAAQHKLNVDGGGPGAPPAKLRAPAWASVTDAVASFTRRLGFRLLHIKIHRRMGTIYRAFCTESETTNILTLS